MWNNTCLICKSWRRSCNSHCVCASLWKWKVRWVNLRWFRVLTYHTTLFCTGTGFSWERIALAKGDGLEIVLLKWFTRDHRFPCVIQFQNHNFVVSWLWKLCRRQQMSSRVHSFRGPTTIFLHPVLLQSFFFHYWERILIFHSIIPLGLDAEDCLSHIPDHHHTVLDC